MPDFSPLPPILSLSDCDKVATKATWRTCRVAFLPLVPFAIVVVITLLNALRWGRLIWWLLFLCSGMATSWVLFWAPSDPIRLLSTLSDASLEEQSRSRSFGVDKSDSKDKILVVGIGFSGMALCASLIRRGIAFDVVDYQDDIGGLWYSGGYSSVHILSSKLITEFKDYPMPSEYPDNPSQKQMIDYFRTYVAKWRMRDFATFNTVVKEVTALDKAGTQYKVVFESNSDSGFSGTRVYKGVVACVGHHRIPHKIHNSFPGKFTGEVKHSSEYKDPSELKGKRVLTVGGGNSAMDITVEAAREAASCHNSVRNGRWIIPRNLFGLSSLEVTPAWWPFWMARLLMQGSVIFFHGFYQRYNLPFPTHRFGDIHPTISTSYLQEIMFGLVKAHPNIKSFSGKEVTFVDGTSITVDMIIYCTGYDLSFPLFDKLMKFKNGLPQLIQGLAVPGKRNCYAFGVQQPRYGGGPLLTRGAEVIAETIEIQDLMTQPAFDYIGKLFHPLEPPFPTRPGSSQGKQLTNDVITDPFSQTKRIQLMRALNPLLPRLSRWMPLHNREHVIAVEVE